MKYWIKLKPNHPFPRMNLGDPRITVTKEFQEIAKVTQEIKTLGMYFIVEPIKGQDSKDPRAGSQAKVEKPKSRKPRRKKKG